MKIILYIFLFIVNYNFLSIDKIITALRIKNAEEIINHLDSEGEILINGLSSKGSRYNMIKFLNDFYYEKEISNLNIIHKGNSENNLNYILGEYISNGDIYKLFVIINFNNNQYKIEKIKIDLEE